MGSPNVLSRMGERKTMKMMHGVIYKSNMVVGGLQEVFFIE
jgi:hypothetical protein